MIWPRLAFGGGGGVLGRGGCQLCCAASLKTPRPCSRFWRGKLAQRFAQFARADRLAAVGSDRLVLGKAGVDQLGVDQAAVGRVPRIDKAAGRG